MNILILVSFMFTSSFISGNQGLLPELKSSLNITVASNGSYSLKVNETQWLLSDATYVHMNGMFYSTKDGSLHMNGKITDSGITDTLGPWTSIIYNYTAGTSLISLSFKVYKDVPVVIFEQTFVNGGQNTSTGDVDNILSAFPNFKLDGSGLDLGYLAYGGIMVADTGKKMGRFNSKDFRIESGRTSGPIAIFDKSGRTIFMSPFNNFMAASAYHNQKDGSYGWGIMGGVKQIPKDFSLGTILYYSDEGIDSAIAGWGELMRGYYKKTTEYRDSDITLNYLSYWTDNGAYYVQYYEPSSLIQNMTYEESMLKTKEYADKTNLPYKSIQYSVWFKQGKGNGIALWEANPKLFPDGMQYMFQKTQLPATAHNRWWTPDTPYAIQNGGNYAWIIEKDFSLPMDQMFWIDFFKASRQMGFTTLMQDWLNEQFGAMEATLSSVDTARKWLMQMGEGARLSGLTIQYCMSMSRHVLQSLEIPVVNQARASGDYSPGDEAQYQIGISSMLSHAVGIAPFKDTFWTTTDQPGNYYKQREPYPELQAVVATLSTGPVGPGDMVGGTNHTLLMKCCRDDGLILKPSLPAFAINAQILQSAFGGSMGPVGEVWQTKSFIGGYTFGIILAAMMKNKYTLSPENWKFGSPGLEYAYYTFGMLPVKFNKESQLELNEKCMPFCIYYASPVMNLGGNELILMGELDKWVPLSPQRISDISQDEADVTLTLKLAIVETVNFTYMYSGKLYKITCKWSGAEEMVISVMNHTCMVKEN